MYGMYNIMAMTCVFGINKSSFCFSQSDMFSFVTLRKKDSKIQLFLPLDDRHISETQTVH